MRLCDSSFWLMMNFSRISYPKKSKTERNKKIDTKIKKYFMCECHNQNRLVTHQSNIQTYARGFSYKYYCWCFFSSDFLLFVMFFFVSFNSFSFCFGWMNFCSVNCFLIMLFVICFFRLFDVWMMNNLW